MYHKLPGILFVLLAMSVSCGSGDGGGDGDCESRYEKKCYSGDVYWYDSCGMRGEKYETCASDKTCSGGKCISGPSHFNCDYIVDVSVGMIPDSHFGGGSAIHIEITHSPTPPSDGQVGCVAYVDGGDPITINTGSDACFYNPVPCIDESYAEAGILMFSACEKEPTRTFDVVVECWCSTDSEGLPSYYYKTEKPNLRRSLTARCKDL